ncbi:MAG: hypothetical protein HQK84_05510 [Nitrospinae bacterium]|nr:hypothetical protein [Nitrospinota bacterium]
MQKLNSSLFSTEPTRLLIVAFASAILLGTFLLSLPFSTNAGSISFLDALFTATSATCVTGLMVVDAGTTFTLFGQSVIIVLMQVGGLGIMTFSTIIIFMLGKQISFKEKWMVQDSFSSAHGSNVFHLVRNVFILSCAVELIGLILLFIAFYEDMEVGEAFFYAFFHTVSGFCNAGITLFPDSLKSYKDNYFINFIFIALIIIGSLGFLVIAEMGSRLFRKGNQERIVWTFHTRVIILFSFVLLTVGTVLFMLMEQEHTLEGENFFNQLLIAFFQTVTKTAGFVTVDFSDMAESSTFMFLLFMFIGAAPGSVGGGIKITTFAVLFALTVAKFKNEEKVTLMKRTIESVTVGKTITIVIISSVIIGIFFMLLLISEAHALNDIDSQAMFVKLLFESVSAFGTVGLSMGITETLSNHGKCLIIILMFIGRLGPLTLAIAISRRERKERFVYSEEKLMVG